MRKSDGAIIVPAQEKTDFGRGVTEMVFRSAREWRLSTGYYFHLLRGRARGKGVDDALFCAEDGRRYTRSDSICKALRDLLERMNIEGYTAYSFRHSLIQALFDAGLSELQVNAYTGHSNNSHTAANYYYHLDKAWAGDRIRVQPTDRVPLSREAIRVIKADGPEE